MSLLSPLRELDREQRHTVLASFLGWMLDAFDYFLLTFVIVAIAEEFRVGKAEVTYALFLTLAARPLGALLFAVSLVAPEAKFGRASAAPPPDNP